MEFFAKSANCHANNMMGYLVWVGQILTVLCDVLPNEDVAVFKENVEQLVYTVQALLPHVRLKGQ